MASSGTVPKPLPISLFQGIKKKKMRWPSAIGLFESRARKKKHLTFLFYYICLLCYLQICKTAGLASALIGNIQDLGSSPRSSPPFHIIFQLTIMCRHNVVVHCTSSKINVHVSQSVRSKATNWRLWWTLVHASHASSKSQQGQAKWAWIAREKPPCWGLQPP